jgi:hypothetical protein
MLVVAANIALVERVRLRLPPSENENQNPFFMAVSRMRKRIPTSEATGPLQGVPVMRTESAEVTRHYRMPRTAVAPRRQVPLFKHPKRPPYQGNKEGEAHRLNLLQPRTAETDLNLRKLS